MFGLGNVDFLQLVLLQVEQVFVHAAVRVHRPEEFGESAQLLRLRDRQWVFESSDRKGRPFSLPLEDLREVLNLDEAVGAEHENVLDIFDF